MSLCMPLLLIPLPFFPLILTPVKTTTAHIIQLFSAGESYEETAPTRVQLLRVSFRALWSLEEHVLLA